MANKENEITIERLMDYYKAYKLNELAKKMNVKYDSLSSWKRASTLNPLKNLCRELGIYNEIFNADLVFDTKNNCDNLDNKNKLDIETILYSNKELKEIIRNWGCIGYGIVVGVILCLKENNLFLDTKKMEMLADDLKISIFLLREVAGGCDLFLLKHNGIELKKLDN